MVAQCRVCRQIARQHAKPHYDDISDKSWEEGRKLLASSIFSLMTDNIDSTYDWRK